MIKTKELNNNLFEFDTKIQFYSLMAKQYNDDIIEIEQKMKYKNKVLTSNQEEIKNCIYKKENLNNKQLI